MTTYRVMFNKLCRTSRMIIYFAQSNDGKLIVHWKLSPQLFENFFVRNNFCWKKFPSFRENEENLNFLHAVCATGGHNPKNHAV